MDRYDQHYDKWVQNTKVFEKYKWENIHWRIQWEHDPLFGVGFFIFMQFLQEKRPHIPFVEPQGFAESLWEL